MKRKKVWFIRHAESKTNSSENYRADSLSLALVPLSDFGFTQSDIILEYFENAPDLIITSPFIRTKQTAESLVKKYPKVLQEEWEIQEFTYLSPEKCFNKTFKDRKPLVASYWEKSDPLYRDGKGAESFVDFFNRINKVFEQLKLREEEFIVLFSHQYVMLALKFLLEKKPKKITKKVMANFRDYCNSNKIKNIEKIEIFI